MATFDLYLLLMSISLRLVIMWSFRVDQRVLLMETHCKHRCLKQTLCRSFVHGGSNQSTVTKSETTGSIAGIKTPGRSRSSRSDQIAAVSPHRSSQQLGSSKTQPTDRLQRRQFVEWGEHAESSSLMRCLGARKSSRHSSTE